jgi:hypothetical protein
MDYDPLSTKFNIFQDQYFKNLTSDAGAVLLAPTVLQPGDPTTMKAQLQNSSLVIDLTPLTAFQSTYGNWQTWMGYSDSNITKAEATALSNYQGNGKYVNSFDAPPFARNKELWRFDLVSNQGALGRYFYSSVGVWENKITINGIIQS